MKPLKKNQILIDTGFNLFKQHGFKATGVDLITKESNISKATMYKYFTNKDLLILAVLKHRHDINMQEIKNAINEQTETKEPVLGIFDAYHQRFQKSDFFGCLFIRAATEYNQKDSSINHFISKVRLELRDLLINHLKTESRNKLEAEKKANWLMILIDGAIINAQVCQNKNAAIEAKRIAGYLLKQDGHPVS